MWSMIASQFLKVRVSPQTKDRVLAAALARSVTESNWVRRVIENAIRETTAMPEPSLPPMDVVARDARVYVRLRSEDQLLLRERARARDIAVATYVSVLVRAHLRNLAPLPKAELLALRQTVSGLSAIGRHLNQLAKLAAQGSRAGSAPNDFGAMLKICEGLRDHVKALLKANVISWSVGHAEPRK